MMRARDGRMSGVFGLRSAAETWTMAVKAMRPSAPTFCESLAL